jgi:tetratricopeptide (TPR) repeat protein
MGWSNHAEGLYFEKIQILKRDGRFEEAEACCNELVAFNRARGYDYGVGAAHHNLGLVLSARPKAKEAGFAGALRAYGDAQAIREKIGDHSNLAWTLNNRGFLLLELGRFDEARPLLEKAYRLFTRFFLRDGQKMALENLRKLGREAKQPAVQTEAQRGLKALESAPSVVPVPFEFVPEKKNLAYYLFLREDDLAPVVRVFGEEKRLRFEVVATGETFEVPVDPRPKRLVFTFEAPQPLMGTKKAAVARAEFTVHGGRGVLYGRSFLFLADGSRARSDRQGNLRLGKAEGKAEAVLGPETGPWTYGSASHPVGALRTVVESINRGDWETFSSRVSPFALTWIHRDSFQATHEKHEILPLSISVSGGKMRNPAWVEIRYSYSPRYERALELWETRRKKKGEPPPTDEARAEQRKLLEARFAKQYGENRYKAFLVRDGEVWRLDFLDRE